MLFWNDDKRTSDKNGDILVRRGIGGPNVIVGGYSQTGEGLNAIWRDALKRALPSVVPEPRVLILGLGGGGMLGDVYKMFLGARVTAVDHDPEMIKITHELKYFEPFPPPDIICADALDAVRGLETAFDLIAIDMFRGGEVSPHYANAEFWDQLKKRLTEQGIVLVNVAGSREFLEGIGRHFSHADMWRCEANYLGMFSA